jgi:hypothetical protein
MTLSEVKNFLRVDDEEDNALISSLIITAQILTEDIIRCKLEDFSVVPEPINQAMLILIGTLYEERQVKSDPKSGISLDATLDLVKKMLFSYRKERF